MTAASQKLELFRTYQRSVLSLQFVPGQLSGKILREARAQQEEVDAEEAGLGPAAHRTVCNPPWYLPDSSAVCCWLCHQLLVMGVMRQRRAALCASVSTQLPD